MQKPFPGLLKDATNFLTFMELNIENLNKMKGSPSPEIIQWWSLCTSIELCIHINADARFQFNCDAVIPDVYKNCANHDCLHSLLPH